MENLSRDDVEIIKCYVNNAINDNDCDILGLWEKYSQISNYDVYEVQVLDHQMNKQKFVFCSISTVQTINVI